MVSILNVFCPKIARVSKCTQTPHFMESRYHSAKANINLSDTTESRVRAAWTQGDVDAPKIGDFLMPQPFPIPGLSLAECGSRMEESPQWEIISNSPAAP